MFELVSASGNIPDADGSESTEAASSEADGDSGSAARDSGMRMGPTEPCSGAKAVLIEDDDDEGAMRGRALAGRMEEPLGNINGEDVELLGRDTMPLTAVLLLLLGLPVLLTVTAAGCKGGSGVKTPPPPVDVGSGPDLPTLPDQLPERCRLPLPPVLPPPKLPVRCCAPRAERRCALASACLRRRSKAAAAASLACCLSAASAARRRHVE